MVLNLGQSRFLSSSVKRIYSPKGFKGKIITDHLEKMIDKAFHTASVVLEITFKASYLVTTNTLLIALLKSTTFLNLNKL